MVSNIKQVIQVVLKYNDDLLEDFT